MHLAFRRIKTSESHRELQRLTGECPRLTFGGVPPVGRRVSARTLGFALLAQQLRHDTDYLRYLAPVYSDAASLRKRAAARAGRGVRGRARVGGGRGVPLLRGVVDAAEASIEPHPNVVEYLAERRPDVVLVTPSRRVRVEPDRLRARRPAPRDPHRLSRLQLGQPDEQGPRPRPAGAGRSSGTTLQAAEAVELHGVPARARRASRARRTTTTGSTGSRAARARSSARGRASGPTARSSSTFARRRSSRRTRSTFVRRWVAALRAARRRAAPRRASSSGRTR